uniref:CSON001313 protein n=1 Tax=Culicoides sonorensis TaxID=179676 RepID=A0A336LHP3_CULSO
MSSLASISYTDGDVVWVRLSNSWWPGEVVDESKLPEGLLASLKRQPIAVVRFFQESTFEYVYSIDKICLYNNQRKHNFIKKGLEGFRAKKKFMETFPEDVAIAEKMVNGDPDIINSEEFQPTSKSKKDTWNDIFVDPNKKQKTPKKDNSETPGQITYHRNSDHEVRILEQANAIATTPTSNQYKCRVCTFSTNRMNVFILHNKTHTKEELASPKSTHMKIVPKSKTVQKSIETPKPGRTIQKSLRELKKTPIIDDFVDEFLNETYSDKKTSKKKRRGKKTTPAKATTEQVSEKKSQIKEKPDEKVEEEDNKINTEIRKELLADWSDEDVGTEEKPLTVEPKDESTNSIDSIDKDNTKALDILKKDEKSDRDLNSSTSPVKCRNIPKKRDFVFDDVKNDEKHKREVEKQLEIEKKINEKLEKEKEREEKRKLQEEKRKQQLEEKRKAKEEKRRQYELKKQEEEAKRQEEIEKQQAEEQRKFEEKEKRIKDEKAKIEVKKKMKGDFDLLMEQLEETPPPVRVSKRNKNKMSEPISKPQKIQSPTPESNKSEQRKSRRNVTEAIKKSEEPEIGEDDALAQEMEELLKETAVPNIVKDLEKTGDRKLPPKERGKRIFKESKNLIDGANQKVLSPTKAVTESDLIIAEALTQMQHFSPSKSPPAKSRQTNDNEIPETLINFDTPQKSISSPTGLEISSNSITSGTTSSIPNPRKRHLRALEEKCQEMQQQQEQQKDDENAERKIELLTKRQRIIHETQIKLAESPTKTESRLPKKRKSEYQSEFESVVNKKMEEDRKVSAIPEKKIARSSSRTLSSNKKADDTLFDIDNMEIVFDNDPISSKRGSELIKVGQTVALSPVRVTKNVTTTTTKVISSMVNRKEPHVIQLHQDSRIERLSPIPQKVSSIKNTEIRRLSFPTLSTKEQKLTPTHRKVMKLITQPDGTTKLIEEVQPTNITRSSPTTSHPLLLRASSSSPLAKNQRSMTESIVSTSKVNVTQKPQVVVGGASNKIIITSKGSLLTTTSPSVSTNASMRTSTSNIRTGNKIQVQSEIIIPSSRVTSRIIENSPVTTTRKEIIYSSTKTPSTPIHTDSPRSTATPLVAKEKSKSNVIKLSTQQLREAEALGYVEMRGNSKVLTKVGLKEFLPKINPNYKLKRKDSGSCLQASNISESNLSRKKSIDTSIISLDGDESSQKLKITPQNKPIYKAINNDPIVIPDEEVAPSSQVTKDKFVNQSIKLDEKILTTSNTVISLQDSPIKTVVSNTPVINETQTTTISKESPSTTSVISSASVSTPVKENSNLNDQNSQILAVPAENFDGPANAFYLCSVNEDGSFTPMNNEALYLDASNQLVPMLPEVQEKNVEINADELVNNEVTGQSIILNTGDGQQIILDQQSLLAMAASGDVSQLFTQDGQQLILPGSAQEILNAIAASQTELGDQPILIQGDQDILATALANTEVFQQDQLLAGSLGDLNPPVKAHVSETNTVLTQSPIMSTSEQPTKKSNGNIDKTQSELGNKNLDEKLAEIGVAHHQTNVPVSLELPITVTNPAIAPKTTTNPLEINSIYPTTPLISTALVGVLPTSTSTTSILSSEETEEITNIVPMQASEADEQSIQNQELSQIASVTPSLNSEISDEFIPDTPENENHQIPQELEDTNSSEIPLQSNIVSEKHCNDLKNNGTLTENTIETAHDSNGINEHLINNNSEDKDLLSNIDISDIPLPGEPSTAISQQPTSTESLQMDVDES